MYVWGIGSSADEERKDCQEVSEVENGRSAWDWEPCSGISPASALWLDSAQPVWAAGSG